MQANDPRCVDCGQRSLGVFCSLVPLELEKLDGVKHIERYRPGDVLLREGQKPRGLFCIYSGRVKVFMVGRRDEAHVIRLLGPADLLGYRSLLASEPCLATAEAIEATTVCVFPPHVLFDMVRDHPDFALQLLARLARDLRGSQEFMLIRTQEAALQRAARILIWLHGGEHPGSPTPPRTVISVKRSEIARLVGTTPETLSRVLHELAGNGLLRLTHTDIEILNVTALNALAEGGNANS